MSYPIYVPSKWGTEFASLTEDEALGGGSVGPGKSMVLLYEPLPQIEIEHKRCQLPKDHEHYHPWGMSTGKALHLRRTMPMLSETISRAKRAFFQLDPNVKWNETTHTFTFSSGYQYQFGHCKDSDGWLQYFSNEFSIILWDELVQFEKEQYENINFRLRSSDPILSKMLKIRAMSNPVLRFDASDGVSVKDPFWVREYYVDPAPKGRTQLRTKVTLADGTQEYTTRIFLPATLYDNPDPNFVKQYERRLQGAAPHKRAALLFGDWYASAGSFFSEHWNPSIHTCEAFRIPKEWPRFRSMDWGYKSPGCIHWYAVDPDGTLFVEREVTFQGKTATEVALRVKDIEISEGVWDKRRDCSLLTGPADTQLWEQRGESGISKDEEFRRVGVNWTKADKKSRQRNAERVSGRLKDHENGTKPPGLVIFKNCRNLLKTLPAIPTDPNNVECPLDGANDHWYDSLAYGVAYASRDRHQIIKDEDDWGDEDKPRRAKSPGRYWGYGS